MFRGFFEQFEVFEKKLEFWLTVHGVRRDGSRTADSVCPCSRCTYTVDSAPAMVIADANQCPKEIGDEFQSMLYILHVKELKNKDNLK